MHDERDHASNPRLLTHAETAIYLGVTKQRLSTLQGGIHHFSQLPKSCVGSKVLYDIADLDAWIARHGKGPNYLRKPHLQQTSGTSALASSDPVPTSSEIEPWHEVVSALLNRLVRIESKLNSMATQLTALPGPQLKQPSPPARKGYMNIRETAAYLRVSKQALYNSYGKWDIPCVRLGRRILFHPDRLDAWLTEERKRRR